jgi:uncharacterized protein (DUF2384 family)
MPNDELNQDAFAALRARFQDQSRRAQAYYAVMHEVRGVLGSDEAASGWMEQPLPELDGRTPAQLVADGQEEQVLARVRALRG